MIAFITDNRIEVPKGAIFWDPNYVIDQVHYLLGVLNVMNKSIESPCKGFVNMSSSCQMVLE